MFSVNLARKSNHYNPESEEKRKAIMFFEETETKKDEEDMLMKRHFTVESVYK